MHDVLWLACDVQAVAITVVFKSSLGADPGDRRGDRQVRPGARAQSPKPPTLLKPHASHQNPTGRFHRQLPTAAAVRPPPAACAVPCRSRRHSRHSSIEATPTAMRCAASRLCQLQSASRAMSPP